jgi:hypothetical protein
MAEVLTQEQIAAAEAAGASELELSSIFKLKQLAADFAQAFQNMLSWESAVAGTDLEAEYDRLMDRGFSLRDRVADLMNTIDSMISTVAGWWRKLVSYIPGLGTMRPYESGTLGVVWFVPVAAIAAVVTALGFWLADYAKFAKRFSEAQRIAADLQAEGVSPIEAQRQAAAAVAGTAPGFLSNLSGPLGLVGLGLGGWLIYRMVQDGRA